MTVADILPIYPLESIEVRTYGPWGEDILFGYCSWTGEELLSIDGDTYYLDDEIDKYEFDGNNLTYWIKGEWIGAED